MRGALDRFVSGWLFVQGVVAAIVLTDAAFIVYRFDGEPWGRITLSWAALSFVALVAGLPCALGAGTLAVIATPHERPPWPVRFGTWLFQPQPDVHVLRIATLLTVLSLAKWSFLLLVSLTSLLTLNVVQDSFRSLSVGLVALAIAAGAAAAFPFVRRVALTLVRGLLRVPGLRWFFERTGRLIALMLVISAAVVTLVLFRSWNDLAIYFPWTYIVRATSAFTVFAAASALYSYGRERRAVVYSVAVVPLVVLGGTAPFAIPLSPDLWSVRNMAFEETIAGGAGRDALELVADRDHDGSLSFLGGGDCAPTDPRIYYGASEIPNNKIDEDCDGKDLVPQAFASRGVINYPVPADVPRRPNVVFITIDALSAHRLGAMGYARKITPNLDALIERSTFFESAFSQGPSTRLSFPSIFTSKWDSLLEREPIFRQIPHSLASSERQIQDALGDAGYDTVAILPDGYFVPSYWPSVTRGFAHVDTSAIIRSPTEEAEAGFHTATRVTEAALRALKQPRKKPLYLWAHYYDPHSPYKQPANVPTFGSTQSDIYDAEIMSTDAALKPLIDAVADDPNTLLIVSSDHATVFHPNPKARKGHYGYDVYTATLHVPLIVHGKFVPKRRWPKVVSTLDIFPTIANVLRLNPKRSFYGTSLVPEIFEGRQVHPPFVFSEFFLEEYDVRDHRDALLRVGVRDDKYDLVLDRENGGYELYDWRHDYYELDDLAQNSDYAKERDRLRSLLSTFVYELHERPWKAREARRAEAAKTAPVAVEPLKHSPFIGPTPKKPMVLPPPLAPATKTRKPSDKL